MSDTKKDGKKELTAEEKLIENLNAIAIDDDELEAMKGSTGAKAITTEIWMKVLKHLQRLGSAPSVEIGKWLLAWERGETMKQNSINWKDDKERARYQVHQRHAEKMAKDEAWTDLDVKASPKTINWTGPEYEPAK